MAIQCTNCGQRLLKENAQFCSRCGAPTSLNSASSMGQQGSRRPPRPPLREQAQASGMPGRELRVRVREQPGSQASLHPEVTLAEAEAVIVDEATRPLAGKTSFREEETLPLPSVPYRNPQATQLSEQTRSQLQYPISQPIVQRPPLTPQPSTQGWRQQTNTPPASVAVPPVAAGKQGSVKTRTRVRAGGRTWLVLVGGLLLLLVAGGLVAWVVVFHPFAVPEVTQPQQDFQNADLGIVLQYPRGWVAQADKKNQTIHLYDSNHTDQVNIVATTANGTDAGQYAQKEVSQLGMTALKPKTTVTFGGTSWQQIRGNVVLSGASYAETIYVTLHNGRFFSLMQLAPQTTYDAEEQITFAAIRTSFKFST